MKTTNTFGVQFIGRRLRGNPHEAVIYVRITVSKKRIEISLKRTVDPLYWNRSAGRIKGNKEIERRLNPYIEDVRYKLMECYRQLQVEKKTITAVAIKSLFLGEEKSENTLCGLIDYHNVNMKTILAPGTMKNYFTTEKYVKLFLTKKHKTDDIFLSDLNFQFITEFEFFLRKGEPLDASNPLENNGVMKHMERLKKMVALAAKMEWIPKDPFQRYRLRFQKVDKAFLTTQEFTFVETKNLNSKLNLARDLFVFSCYTGLSYVDLTNLRPSNICIGIDSEYWIKTFRQKTDIPVNVPLLSQAKLIIDKYKNDPRAINKGSLFPSLSNQKINQYLKEIAVACDINKDLSFHTERHTFATTITLTNGVPIETVSKMLGHTKLSTTQIYARVLEKKVSQDMQVLRNKLNEQTIQNLKAI